MIVTFLLQLLFTIIYLPLNLLPNIPAMDPSVESAITSFTNLLPDGVALLAYIFTSPILIFGLTAILIILNFDNIRKFVLWVYHLIRG